jgi:hypothetical protein
MTLSTSIIGELLRPSQEKKFVTDQEAPEDSLHNNVHRKQWFDRS